MKKTSLRRQSGFTLVELLIVVGILAILAVTLLLTLNPGQAQAKSRDVQRSKDATTLQAIMEGIINDGNTIAGCLTSASGCQTTADGSGNIGTTCNHDGTSTINWLQTDVCAYAKSLPVDPMNAATRNVVNGGSTTQGVMIYRVRATGSNYEINVRQESTSNANKVTADGGNSTQWYEIGSSLNLLAN